MRVSVIVPAHDASSTIERTLAALQRQEVGEPYEVIVVDDGSRDGTAAVARAAGGPVRVIEQDHAGPAAARNRGVAAASGDLLAFTDADCAPGPDWLAAGVSALERADLVVGAVLPDPEGRMGPWDRSLWVLEENGLYETANLFVTRRVFDAVGGFDAWLDPEVGKPIAEDVWLGWRIRRSGARTLFCRQAIVYHAVFRRRVWEHVLERRRLRHFPDIAAKIPELRETLFFGRVFLNARTAAFDAALAGAALAAVTRSPLALVAAVPYAALSLNDARRWGTAAPKVVAGELAADTVGLVSLVRGSVRRRSLVL